MTDTPRKRGRPPGAGTARTALIKLRVTPDEQAAYQAAADAADVPLSEWVRGVLGAYAGAPAVSERT